MAKARMQTPRKPKKHKKQEKIFRSRCTLLDEAQFTTFLYRTDKTGEEKKKQRLQACNFLKKKKGHGSCVRQEQIKAKKEALPCS
jgi:replication fork clamp-binding protein CrfC